MDKNSRVATALHKMQNKKTGKEGYMAMKLDKSKAYDKVEWVFLEKLIVRMGVGTSACNSVFVFPQICGKYALANSVNKVAT